MRLVAQFWHGSAQWKLILAIVVFGCSGCQFAPSVTQTKWPWSKKVPVMPDRILTVWSDSVLHQPGLPGVRGFGGRVYFYQAPSTDPIEVDGGVAVYVFDADELSPKNQKPIRKFVFTADQLAEHMSKSSLGPSYSLWLPWDEVGGESRRLSLITRFEGRQGGTVISDPSIKLLPGVLKSTEEGSPSHKSTDTNVRMVGHQQHFSEPVVTQEQVVGRGIETIDLPPSFQQHLRRNSQSNNSSSIESSQPKPSAALTIPPASSPPTVKPTATPAAIKPNTTDTASPDSNNSAGWVTQVQDSRSGAARPSFGQKRNIREGRSIQSPR
jgi:hypothetical protein